MSIADILRYATASEFGYRGRTALILLAMGMGVASVVLLTALGESARRYVTGQFESLGTHLLIVLPGRSETSGGPPPLLGETPRDLTLDDAFALARSRYVRRVAPVSVGSAAVSYRQREREISILGTTASFLEVRRMTMARGRFLPAGDARRAAAVGVIGAKVERELFGRESALGHWVRIGDRRFRVVGILATEGRSIGVDVEDIMVIPVASAMSLFDTESLFRVLVEAGSDAQVEHAKADIRRIIRDRHEGEDDVTVITQDAVIATFDRIFHALTLTVAGIASISLAVAGILIMNVMLVAVSQRTAEVGLLKALGAPEKTIARVFLAEAGLLSFGGALAGIAVGFACAHGLGLLYPALDFVPPPWAVGAGGATALVAGLVFGVLPARRAAALDPVRALAGR